MKKLRPFNRWFPIVAALVVIGAVLNLTHLDARVWYLFHDLTTSSETKERSIWLPDYQADVKALPIPGVTGNASGVTFDRSRQTLWITVNSPTFLVELDLDFNLLRRVELENFKDTEAVAYIEDDRFLLTDERDQTIAIAHIDEYTERIDRNDLQQLVLSLHEPGNKGLEGIAVDPTSYTIFAVRERDPKEFIRVSGFIENQNRICIDYCDQIEVNDLYMDDLSGLHFDLTTGHLLFLSDESKILAEIDRQGKMLSYMDLRKGFHDLNQSIPQPEGVALDDDGNLYIVSEPNLLYRFRRVECEDESAIQTRLHRNHQ